MKKDYGEAHVKKFLPPGIKDFKDIRGNLIKVYGQKKGSEIDINFTKHY